jgi:DNA repair photolyase
MSLVKSKGNMYDWVTHMHTHIAGQCPHKCSYCYVQTGVARISGKYKGELRLIDKEFSVNYGKDKIIFIEHMNDMFAEQVPEDWIKKILFHCCDWQENQYIFQTKNPFMALNFTSKGLFPKNFIIGTTIESTHHYKEVSESPSPLIRYLGIKRLSYERNRVFITIEPILDFDLDMMVEWITEIHPEFVNIGADSKGCGLTEPSTQKIYTLIDRLTKEGVIIKKKINLKRLGVNLEQ